MIDGFDLDSDPVVGWRWSRPGTGKSTIANIASGLLEPWDGNVATGVGRSPARTGTLERALAKVDQTVVLFEAASAERDALERRHRRTAVRRALADARSSTTCWARPAGSTRW